MPWDISQVDKHKKGLSPEQKKKWVATANSALAACIKKGGTDKSCAPHAIRIANSVTGHEEGYSTHKSVQEPNYEVFYRKYQGKQYLIAPVTMMIEGVHHGSHGPVLHLIDELGKYPESWNGIPVVVDHPQMDGVSVSANYPDIIDERKTGRIYNTFIDGNRLKSQIWIDSDKLEELSAELLEQLKKGELIEVSVGVFNDEEIVAGDWNGEHYEAIARNHRPDHLALLPGSVGACSIMDGCGIRVNIEGSTNLKTKEVNIMADNAVCPDVKKKVDELIANSQGKYTEDDREVLQTLSVPMLDKIAQPVTVEKTVEVEKIVEKEVQVNVLSDEDKAALEFGKNQLKEQRDTLTKNILTNSKDVWTEELLVTKDLDDLKRISSMIKKEDIADYSPFGAGEIQTNAGDVPILMPLVVEDAKN
jgi:hypothetical protein